MNGHELDSDNGVHTCTGCLWAVFTYTDLTDPEGTREHVNRAFAKHLLETALEEPMTTVRCIACDHTETLETSQRSSDAMERHYWDEHYSQSDRDHLRANGQAPERMGSKP